MTGYALRGLSRPPIYRLMAENQKNNLHRVCRKAIRQIFDLCSEFE